MLILIAHGSRDPSWRRSLEELAESLQAELGQERLGLAYMQCSPPTLMDVASEAVRRGEGKIRVLPLFLARQGHVERTVVPLVKQLVEQLRPAHPSVEVELLPPIGQHPLFRDLLRRIAKE